MLTNKYALVMKIDTVILRLEKHKCTSPADAEYTNILHQKIHDLDGYFKVKQKI